MKQVLVKGGGVVVDERRLVELTVSAALRVTVGAPPFEVRGVPGRVSRTVFISNHLSHLDIPVIGGVLRACFVAKDEPNTAADPWPSRSMRIRSRL